MSDFDKIYDDEGLFQYEDDGFVYAFDNGPKKISWSEVVRIAARKVDEVTYEEIFLDITCTQDQFTITEDTPGYWQFVNRTRIVFPYIAADWEDQITSPSFNKKELVILDRKPKNK